MLTQTLSANPNQKSYSIIYLAPDKKRFMGLDCDTPSASCLTYGKITGQTSLMSESITLATMFPPSGKQSHGLGIMSVRGVWVLARQQTC